jgi:hypothetical protein
MKNMITSMLDLIFNSLPCSWENDNSLISKGYIVSLAKVGKQP